MAKGFFTQAFCLLTDGRTTIDDIAAALESAGIEIVKTLPARSEWCFGGPGFVISYRPEVNGYAAVDLVNEPWPDAMGDPNSEPSLFGAWSMGFFGPYADPGSLERATVHTWACAAAKTISAGHRGFVRVRLSYVFGSSDDAPILPESYNPLDEMTFLSRAAVALLGAPGVLCYFNPNGEVLRDRESFRSVWDACREQKNIPLPLWMNIRCYSLDETIGVLDTVGNGQLDIRDLEAIFPKTDYRPVDVDYYLRNVTHYLMDLDREIKSGEAIDGPGENNLSWTIELLDHGIVNPPRPVMRLYPTACSAAVRAAIIAARPSGTV